MQRLNREEIRSGLEKVNTKLEQRGVRIVLKYFPDRPIPERSVAFVEELSHRLSEAP